MDDQNTDRILSDVKVGKLRIAFSVVCGIICVLLIAVWARSYYHYDFASHNFSGKCGFIVESIRGEAFIKYAPGALIVDVYGSSTPDRSRPTTGKSTKDTWAGFGFATFPDGRVFAIPFWFLSLTAGAFAAAPWARKLQRFSLRTLLIATTLVAVILGAIVYAAK